MKKLLLPLLVSTVVSCEKVDLVEMGSNPSPIEVLSVSGERVSPRTYMVELSVYNSSQEDVCWRMVEGQPFSFNLYRASDGARVGKPEPEVLIVPGDPEQRNPAGSFVTVEAGAGLVVRSRHVVAADDGFVGEDQEFLGSFEDVPLEYLFHIRAYPCRMGSWASAVTSGEQITISPLRGDFGQL